jgi:hypothetical protein
MEFSDEEKKTYSTLVKEPISIWLVVLCFVACFVIYSVLKNYAGWSWLADLHIELPMLVLIVLVSIRSRITPQERNLFKKLSQEHPELVGETEGQRSSEGL